MRKLKVYYAQVDNMGDKLNSFLIKNLFGYEIVRHTPLTCELSGIGSGLGQFTYGNKAWLSCVEYMTGKLWPETAVWGTGFINQKEDRPFYRKNMQFYAVRGELSKKRVENLLGHSIECVLGDGGILTECAMDRREEKKYSVGIIAHYKEQRHPIFQKLLEQFSGSVFIDTRKEPEMVAMQIDQCECILSSSLHGLIIADSLGIPNLHIKVSDAMLGDGFKFDDYYSSYGVEHKVINLNKTGITSLYTVYDGYQITSGMVEKQKEDMLKAFPFR